VTHELDENNAVKAVYHNEPQQYGGVLSQRRGTTSHYHHHDALGSTRFLTDSSGNVTDTYLHDAWGNLVASTGTTTNPFKWVGKYGYYTDNSTTQVYVRARMYQPTVAQWLSVDPLSLWQRLKLFVYGDNAPNGFVDPSGFVTIRELVDENCEEVCKNIENQPVSHSPRFKCLIDCKSQQYKELKTRIGIQRFYFEMWLERERQSLKKQPNWLTGLPDCPCQLDCRVNITGTTPPIITIQLTENDQETWVGPQNLTNGAKYHPFGCLELRSRHANKFGAGQQCVYDNFGKLINKGNAAGTPDRSQARVFTYELPLVIFDFLNDENHIGHDVAPFELALLIYGSDKDTAFRLYQEVRPPNQGKDAAGNTCPENSATEANGCSGK
jgi:RHS repeat-associated protein